LLADAKRVCFAQFAALDFLRERLGQAAARELGGSVNALGGPLPGRLRRVKPVSLDTDCKQYKNW